MPQAAPAPPAAPQVDRLLRLAADEARQQWRTALQAGDFAEIDRWVATGQAVHRALLALER